MASAPRSSASCRANSRWVAPSAPERSSTRSAFPCSSLREAFLQHVRPRYSIATYTIVSSMRTTAQATPRTPGLGFNLSLRHARLSRVPTMPYPTSRSAHRRHLTPRRRHMGGPASVRPEESEVNSSTTKRKVPHAYQYSLREQSPDPSELPDPVFDGPQLACPSPPAASSESTPAAEAWEQMNITQTTRCTYGQNMLETPAVQMTAVLRGTVHPTFIPLLPGKHSTWASTTLSSSET